MRSTPFPAARCGRKVHAAEGWQPPIIFSARSPWRQKPLSGAFSENEPKASVFDLKSIAVLSAHDPSLLGVRARDPTVRLCVETTFDPARAQLPPRTIPYVR
ncbi:hypothetical protein EVAR_24365_1 [Eumeta japonica]|uniref:Uncharacterized protein n=1 Tax=Eumeta variegata TaxID=151549 RepID=A0A4C1YBV7_EUMVA|nr:hypothetical protein EVAR_24365_1 [Eumeta japonica]